MSIHNAIANANTAEFQSIINCWRDVLVHWTLDNATQMAAVCHSEHRELWAAFDDMHSLVVVVISSYPGEPSTQTHSLTKKDKGHSSR